MVLESNAVETADRASGVEKRLGVVVGGKSAVSGYAGNKIWKSFPSGNKLTLDSLLLLGTGSGSTTSSPATTEDACEEDDEDDNAIVLKFVPILGTEWCWRCC